MKKRTRVSLLVFTIVAALAAFGALWYTRPGAPTYVLEEAKARQNMPLLEVQEPARQTPPIEITVDYNVITAKVKASLVEDGIFSNAMAKSVSSSTSALVDSKLDKFRSEIDTKLSQQSVDLLKKLDLKIKNNNKELKILIQNDNSYQAQVDAINDKILRISFDLEKYAGDVKNPANYSVDITKYIPQIVDSVLPEVTEKVLISIDDNKDILFGDIYSEVQNSDNMMTDEQFEAVYARYRDSIVKDLTNSILDDIEVQVTKDLELKLEEQVMQNVVPTEPTFSELEVVVAKPTFSELEVVVAKPTFSGHAVVPSKPIFSGKVKVNDITKQYITSNTISIIATSDGSNVQSCEKDLSKTVKLPTFSTAPTVTILDPAEYDAKRAQIRENAINEILEMIK